MGPDPTGDLTRRGRVATRPPRPPYTGGASRPNHDYACGATNMLRSRNDRFVYLATGSADTTEDRSAPAIRVYRTAR